MFITQKIMNRLIKRYILKAQVDKDNDEVNEGGWSTFVLLCCRGGHTLDVVSFVNGLIRCSIAKLLDQNII